MSHSIIFNLLFQFVVTGGVGCLSYKHPKKITVSILCNKQTELPSCFQLLLKILKNCFSKSQIFLNSMDILTLLNEHNVT